MDCSHWGQHLMSSAFCYSKICVVVTCFCFHDSVGFVGSTSPLRWSAGHSCWMMLILSGVLARIAGGLLIFDMASPDFFTWRWKFTMARNNASEYIALTKPLLSLMFTTRREQVINTGLHWREKDTEHSSSCLFLIYSNWLWYLIKEEDALTRYSDIQNPHPRGSHESTKQ